MARYEQFTLGQLRMPSAATAAGGSRVSLSLTPASVASATIASQNLTVPGVEVGDIIVAVQTPITNATGIVDCSCATAGTVAVRFINPTAGALTPTSGTYTFLVIKA